MENPKIKVSLKSDCLPIIGKYVEITAQESSPEKKATAKKYAAGTLSAFKNPEKVSLEKKAWKTAAIEKSVIFITLPKKYRYDNDCNK